MDNHFFDWLTLLAWLLDWVFSGLVSTFSPSLKCSVISYTYTFLLFINSIAYFYSFFLCSVGATLFHTLSNSFPFIYWYFLSFSFCTTFSSAYSIYTVFFRTSSTDFVSLLTNSVTFFSNSCSAFLYPSTDFYIASGGFL